MKLPRINFVGVTGVVVALISITFSWWGLDGPFGVSFRWGLFSRPLGGDFFGTDQFTLALLQMAPMIIGLILITATIGGIGSFHRGRFLLLGGFSLSLFTSAVYAVVVNTAIIAGCAGAQSCISGPVGSSSSLAWGFQLGFYLFIVSGVLFLIGGLSHGFFMMARPVENQLAATTGKTLKFCFNCGGALPQTAKFCPSCANPLGPSLKDAVALQGTPNSETNPLA